MRAVHLYSARYANTYSIVVVAASLEEARELFIEWLDEHVEGGVIYNEMTLRRRSSGITAPLFAK